MSKPKKASVSKPQRRHPEEKGGIKDRAKKKHHNVLVSSAHYFLDMIFDGFMESRLLVHGGWDECEDSDKAAFKALTEDESVKATIEGFNKFLGTREGFDAVKKLSAPYRDNALSIDNDEFCDLCEGEGCDECEPMEVE